MSRPFAFLALLTKSFLVLLVFCSMNCWAGPLTQTQAAVISLEVAKPIERSLAADETHSFTLNLNAGQYAHVVVDQRGVDVVVYVHAPDGSKIVQVDGPNGKYGFEPLLCACLSCKVRLPRRSRSCVPLSIGILLITSS